MAAHNTVTKPLASESLLAEANHTSNALCTRNDTIRQLVSCGRAAPAWQPACPELGADDALTRRIDQVLRLLDTARDALITARDKLLLQERQRTPFICPPELQQRLTYLRALDRCAQNTDAMRMAAIRHSSQDSTLTPDALKIIRMLLAAAKKGMAAASRDYADALAHRGTPFWEEKHQEYPTVYRDRWQELARCLATLLATLQAEHRDMEEQHGLLLATRIEDRLTTECNELRKAVSLARSVATTADATIDRERRSLEAVKAVWRSTGELTSRVYRSSPPFRDDASSQLIDEWTRDTRGNWDFRVRAMESARRAELVALAIYREIYGAAEDLSRLQVADPRDTRWKLADIAAGGRSIDVKNARRSFSSPNSYSEHCVKRFKVDRIDRQVAISGFLSPYIADREGQSPEPVLWLGEMTSKTIDTLRAHFKSDYLQLDFSGGDGARLPPWLFDYPSECYVTRDSSIRDIQSPEFIFPRRHPLLPLLVLSNRMSNAPQGNASWTEANLLSDCIAANGGPTRPLLFLHVLDRFCRTARDGTPFPAGPLREVMFPQGSGPLAGVFTEDTPLAVLDPLKTVKELLDLLARVAETCADRATAFTDFRLRRAGVLQGRTRDRRWQTIFAYCGGWLPHSGTSVKCGQDPLYLGQNESCSSCGNLVCHKCDYCSETCCSR